MKAKLVKETLKFSDGEEEINEFRKSMDSMRYYIFIDEGEFDIWNPEEYPGYAGVSILPIYAISDDIEEHDNEGEVRRYSDTRDEYASPGTAIVGWKEEGEEPEIIESNIIPADKIILLYPL